MKTRKLTILAIISTITFSVSPTAQAIVWGDEDVNNEYANVVSLTGLKKDSQTGIYYANTERCSGSLLHYDDYKVVFLTAGHCTGVWNDKKASGEVDEIGVSFDQNNKDALRDANYPDAPGSKAGDASNYVTGGIPVSLPDTVGTTRKLDLGLVVFSAGAKNAYGFTINEQWNLLSIGSVRVLGKR